MSPPDANAISERSGEIDGSANELSAVSGAATPSGVENIADARRAGAAIRKRTRSIIRGAFRVAAGRERILPDTTRRNGRKASARAAGHPKRSDSGRVARRAGFQVVADVPDGAI